MNTSYESIDGQPVLCFERRIDHPVAAVWTAITDAGELAKWFPSTITGEMRAGGRLGFSFPDHDEVPDMAGEVNEYDPPSKLGFNWGEDHLRFELSPAGDGSGTDLRFTVVLGSADKAARDGAGWHVCLARLEASLGGAGEKELKQINDGWREHYDEYSRRGFPATAPIPAS
jgi:uncharacterized protein YndB with AHSA1/START domain